MPASAEEVGSFLGLGRSPGGGHGSALQCSCLDDPMDRGAWWATVHRAAKSRHNGSDLTRTARQYILGAIRLARHNDFIM